jgi:two-component system sensor histidine kinase KdpD
VVLYLPDDAGRPVARVSLPIASDTDRGDVTVIESVLVERKVVLAGGAAYLPFTASRGVRGVLFVRPQPIEGGLTSEQIHLLETFVDRIALAVERIWLAEEARQAEMRVETERLRSSILSSISHDLRTPLAAITSAASSLLEGEELLDPVTRVDLKETIYEEANRLARLVNNLLDMTRLEAGLRARKERQPLEDVVGAALARLERNLQDHPVVARLPEDLPLVPLDAVLIEQVLINLLDNAVKYTPVGSPIEIQISTTASDLTVEVADRGPGLPAGDEERVFEKFYRGIAPGVQGAGLGLAICRGIVLAHGGRMWAQNRAGGGVIFRFALPIESSSPPAEVARG